MKKLLIALFSVLIMVGCATKDENVLSYEIDPVATANAPWEVGDTVLSYRRTENEEKREIDVLFLGTTLEGHIVLQDFYNINELHDIKRSEPYSIIDARSLTSDAPYLYHGRYIIYHFNGSISIDCLYDYGTTSISPCVLRDPSGNLFSERTIHYDRSTGQYEAERVIYLVPSNTPGMEIEDRAIFSENNISGTSTRTVYFVNGGKERWVQDIISGKIFSRQAWDSEGNFLGEEDYGTR